MDKASWRRWARDLAPATPEESGRVVAALQAALTEQGWTTVLTFLAMPGEVDLAGFHRTAGVRFLVTRTPVAGPLTVHELTGRLERHKLGYYQPLPEAPEVDPAEADVVLVPGVLFDRRGGRLGHGKGYYDSLLARIGPATMKVGVTLDRRITESVPMSEGDVSIDALVTESGWQPAIR